MQSINVIGIKYSHLLVIGNLDSRFYITKTGQKRAIRMVLCMCDCEKVVEVQVNHLRSGNNTSCGCFKGSKIKHGYADSSEFNIWQKIKQRCNNAGHPQYHLYGGRGITVCERWEKSFEEFFKDMGLRPSTGHSIDRIDNSKGYSKENCRWATKVVQVRNRRVTFRVIYNGTEMALADVVEMTGQNYKRVYDRLRLGWTIDEALKYHKHAKRKYQNNSDRAS